MEEEKYYYIESEGENHGASLGYFLECRECKRKILVEMGMLGTVHHIGPSVTCLDCLNIMDEFREKYPDIVERIESWRQE